MSVQTAFADPIGGINGHVGDNSEAVFDQLLNEEATLSIPFGKVVKLGTEDGCLKVTSGATFWGVAAASPEVEPDASTDAMEYDADKYVPVLRRGRIWVDVEEAVAVTDSVFVRVTASGLNLPGNLRASSGGAIAAVLRRQTLTLSGALDGGTGQIDTLTFDGITADDAGTLQEQTLTLSGALDTGTRRVQRLTLNQAMVGGEIINLDVDGTSIDAQTFATDNDTTLENVKDAILVAAQAAGAGTDGQSSIVDAYIVPADAGETDDRAIEIVSIQSAVLCAITNIVVTTVAGLTFTLSETTAGNGPHTLSCTINGDAVTTSSTGDSDATLQAFAENLANHPAIGSAEVTLVAGGPNLVITVVAATAAPASVVIAAALANNGATARTLTPAETVAGVTALGPDTLVVTVDGTATPTLTFGGDNDSWLRQIADAIMVAAVTAAAGPNGSASIDHIEVRPATGAIGTDRVIEIISKPDYPTAITALTYTDVHTPGVVTCVNAVVTANADPHLLSVQLDAGAALVAEWRGTSDATLQGFADLLASQAAISSAVVTHLTDTGGGIDDADRVIIVTAATGSPTANAFTNALATGGASARTVAVAETVVGIAAVAGQAEAWANARWIKGGTTSSPALLEVFVY